MEDDDQGKFTYFSSKTKLNHEAMLEYELETETNSGDDEQPTKFIDQKKLLTADNKEFIDRFDSRGQKMRIRRG